MLWLATALALCGPPLCASANVHLTLTNVGPECFQTVVEVPDCPVAVSALRTPDGTVVPTQPLKPAGLLTLVPGLFSPGEELTLTACAAQGAPNTDLEVVTEDEYITVRNQFFGLMFPRRGHGGLPIAVEYPFSGHVEREFQWMDRLYEAAQGQLMLNADPEGSAELVEQGPLQVVVETRGRYLKGGQAPGHARAVYRWTFRAFSPVVRFAARVERDDDFPWSELHILQVSRKDARLRNWAGASDQISWGPLRDDNSSRTFTRWGALDDGEHAVGMAWDGKPVIMYDGRSSYVYYLQYVEPFGERSRELTGRLYFGPALSPAGYDEQLMQRAQLDARWGVDGAQNRERVARVGPRPITVGNERLAISFDPDTYGCVRLTDLTTAKDFILPGDSESLTWRLTVLAPDGREFPVLSNTPCHRRHEILADGQRLVLRWEQIPIEQEANAVDVVAEIDVPNGSDRSYWRIQVDNHSRQYSVLSVCYPMLFNFVGGPQTRTAVPRSNWGRLHQGPVGGWYPSCDWPMQFFAVLLDDAGLYVGCEDPGAWEKRFTFTPGEHLRITTLAEDATRPGNDFASPGPVAIGPCGPSWWQACKMYRSWALTAPWTREGPLTARQSTPDFCKDLGLWFCGGGDADSIINNMRRAADFFGVPVGLHWYGWHRWPFDTHYPDYFPAIPDFKQAIDALVPEGKVIMPYINGRIVDKTVDAYAEFVPWTAKNRAGEAYTEVYGNGVEQAPMCPATEFWQNRIPEICEHLIGEYGVNGIYIDQIGAAGPATCYDPTHGHPLGGGSYWVDGYRKLLTKVQEACHRDGRNVLITTENDAEPYMDGVDAFLIWNPRLEDEIPMMTAVYSGYTLYFASNARCGPGLQPYAMIEGRDFIWGSQLGWMGFEDARPTERGSYLRKLVRLRHAALKYVVYGELLGELVPRNHVGSVSGEWLDWSGNPMMVTLPAVMSTLWRGSDGTLGLFLANLSGETRLFQYELDPADFGGLPGEGDWVLLTDIRKEGNTPAGISPTRRLSRTEILQPWEARVLELRRIRSAEDIPGELLEGEQAQRARLDLWAAQNGVEWKITVPPTQAAPADWVHGEVAVRPGPTQPAVEVDLRGGQRSLCTLNPVPDQEGWLRCDVPIQMPRHLEPDRRLYGHIRVRFDDTHQLPVPFSIRAVPELEVTVTPAGPFTAGETAVLNVTLTSNLNCERQGVRVLLEAPGSWELWPGRVIAFPRLQPHQRVTRQVRCRLPHDAPTGELPVKAFILGNLGSTRVPVAPPRPTVQGLRMTPTIDGVLSDWPKEPCLTLGPGQAGNVTGYGGEEDLSARVWLAADENSLYLAAEVTDDVHVQDGQHARMWEGDCLQVDFRPGPPPVRSTFEKVIELGLALTPAGPQLWQWMPTERVVTEAQVQVVREGNQTRYEAAIPWSALPGLSRAPGSVIAFSMTVNERDGDQFGGWLEWTPGICGGKDASRFGRLVL